MVKLGRPKFMVTSRTEERLRRARTLDREAEALLGPTGRDALTELLARGNGGSNERISKLDRQTLVGHAAKIGEKAGEKKAWKQISVVLGEADELRWAVVVDWDGLAKKLSKTQDALQEARIGLYETAKRFDPDRGIQFSTYARWWIRARMTRAIDQDRPMKVGSGRIEQIRNLRKLEQMGKTDSQICEWLGMNAVALDRLRDVMDNRRPTSLDRLLSEDEERPSWEPVGTLVDQSRVEAQLDAEQLSDAISKLPDREAFVLCSRYGIGKGMPDEMSTLSQISKRLGLSRERVRQIESLALQRLRWLLAIETTEPKACRGKLPHGVRRPTLG